MAKQKKQKMRLKKGPVIFLIIIIILFIIWFTPLRTFWRLMSHDYSYEASKLIYKEDITSLVLEKEYSAFLEHALLENKYEVKYFPTYFKVKYQDRKNFIDYTYQLLKLGYSEDNVNLFWSKLTDETIAKIIDQIWLNIDEYLKYPYFKEENIDRYKANETGTISIEKLIVQVNIGLDQEYYENADMVSTFSTTMLVNKYHELPKDFVVPNLEKISNAYSVSNSYLEHETRIAFETMAQDMEKENLHILANSSYRSYEDQEQTYQTYFDAYGQSYVNKYVARPGFTEHSTGLCLDVKARDNNIFKESKESVWMMKNAYRYGFILRYPEGKESITGYNYEPWHFRYVGVEIATYIQNNDITYDEYYVMFLDK